MNLVRFLILSSLLLFCSNLTFGQSHSYSPVSEHSLSLDPNNFKFNIESDADAAFSPKHPAFLRLIAVEAWLLGFSYISTYTWGAYTLGSIYGGGTAMMLGFYIFSDYQMMPGFEIPFMLGLTGLSYYNFRYADIHSGKQKFWTNFIGFNSVGLASFLIAESIDSFSNKRVTYQPGPMSLGLIINL